MTTPDRLVRTFLALVAVVALATAGWTGTAAAQGDENDVFVLGDSVMLGAQNEISSTLAGLGWDVTFDAAVSRTTDMGAAILAGNQGILGDVVVVQLGTNDGATASIFGPRVDDVMAQLSGVSRVYWLSIREARPYYADANAVLHQAAGRYPNLTILDWNGVAGATAGATADDGLHLTPAGAAAMAGLISSSVGQPSGAPPPPPPEPTATPAPPEPAPTPVPSESPQPDPTATSEAAEDPESTEDEPEAALAAGEEEPTPTATPEDSSEATVAPTVESVAPQEGGATTAAVRADGSNESAAAAGTVAAASDDASAASELLLVVLVLGGAIVVGLGIVWYARRRTGGPQA